MTKALYYEYPVITECTAKVLSLTEKDGRCLAVFDRTLFFPEGGGQLPDGGTVEAGGIEAKVLDCRSIDGETVHFLDKPLEEGSTVTLKLDLPRRLDHSQQHTGEHILSGLASRLFGAVNVGFHMAEDYCTIDLDLPLTPEQLAELEIRANEAVRMDLIVHTELTDADEASRRRLRKRAEKAQGEVRIVYIDNGKVDSCTCCGTHLHSTGMVGMIRIADSQHYKGGTRLWFDCGDRAVRAAMDEHSLLVSIARRFSTSKTELEAAISKQGADLASLKAELRQKSALLSESTASALIGRAEKAGNTLVCCELLPGMNANDLRLILDLLASDGASVPFAALLFAPSSAGGTDYRMACSEGVNPGMKELCAAVNAAVNGKGGGKAQFAQGKTERAVDEDTVNMLRAYMLKSIRG